MLQTFADQPTFPRGPVLSAREEVTRVREHLLGAIMQVGSRPTADLSPSQRANRVALLGALIGYAVEGRFPKNISRRGLMAPTFVDHEGTRCAMAHLLDTTGAHELVNGVAEKTNHAYVRELAANAALVEWLVENGLTEEEAARIQPSYCYSPANDCICYQPVVTNADLVAGVVSDTNSLVVDQVFKTETGVVVGDTVSITFNGGDFAAGTRVFASLANGAQLHYAFADADSLSMAACNTFGPAAPETLDLSVLLAIADGAECAATLERVDPQWVEEECDGLGDDDGSVESGGGNEGGSLGHGGQGGHGGEGHNAGDGDVVEGGCSFSSLPPRETGLLVVLILGVALARRRQRRPS